MYRLLFSDDRFFVGYALGYWVVRVMGGSVIFCV